jgi:hypothetical protein
MISSNSSLDKGVVGWFKPFLLMGLFYQYASEYSGREIRRKGPFSSTDHSDRSLGARVPPSTLREMDWLSHVIWSKVRRGLQNMLLSMTTL